VGSVEHAKCTVPGEIFPDQYFSGIGNDVEGIEIPLYHPVCMMLLLGDHAASQEEGG
jgi:hypothetical protein